MLRAIFIVFLCLVSALGLKAQDVKNNGTRAAAVQVIGSVTQNTSTSFTFTASLYDPTSRFSATGVEVGDIVWFECDRFEVTSIVNASGTRADLTVTALTGASTVPRTLGAVVDGEEDVTPYVGRASDATKACMSDYAFLKIKGRIDADSLSTVPKVDSVTMLGDGSALDPLRVDTEFIATIDFALIVGDSLNGLISALTRGDVAINADTSDLTIITDTGTITLGDNSGTYTLAQLAQTYPTLFTYNGTVTDGYRQVFLQSPAGKAGLYLSDSTGLTALAVIPSSTPSNREVLLRTSASFTELADIKSLGGKEVLLEVDTAGQKTSISLKHDNIALKGQVFLTSAPPVDLLASEVLVRSSSNQVSSRPVSDFISVSGAFARDSLAASPLWVTLVRSGGDTTALLTNPAAGRYHIDIPENGSFVSASLFGNNATLSGSNELEIQIDNTENGYKQRLMVQVYDANTGGLVNQFITGTNHTQTVAGFVTTIKLPGMNGFGATGYIIEIR